MLPYAGLLPSRNGVPYICCPMLGCSQVGMVFRIYAALCWVTPKQEWCSVYMLPYAGLLPSRNGVPYICCPMLGYSQAGMVFRIRSRPDRDFRNRTGPDRIGTPDPVDRTGPDRIPDQDIFFPIFLVSNSHRRHWAKTGVP